MQKFLRYEDVPLDKLTQFPGNARRNDVDALVDSIKRHGQYRTLLVRQVTDGKSKNLVLVAGNHTFQAMQKMGLAEARCEVMECTAREALEINLQDNKSSDNAWYDPEAMRDQLEELQGSYDGTGWDSKSAAKYLDDTEGDAPEDQGGPESFNILVICRDEAQQTDLLEKFSLEGLDCKALLT